MSPRGEFLTALFGILDRHGVGYCVLRNYENIYEDNSSDVDLAVQPEEVTGLKEGLAAAAAASGHRLVQRARYINYSHVYWHPEGGFVRVDFDTEFRWRIFPVLTAKAVITLRRKAGAFYVPHPRHESAILFLAAIERGELSERYRERLGRLYQRFAGADELSRTFRAAFGEAGEDLAVCQEQAASPVREVEGELATGAGSALWRRVKRSIVRNSFRDGPSRRLLGKYLRGDLGRLWERVRRPAGMSMLYASVGSAQKSLEDFLERTDVLFPTSKLVVSEAGSSGTWERLLAFFKGGLFIRMLRVERDVDLQRAARRRPRWLFPSRSLVWVESPEGKTFLAQGSSGFMAEFGGTGDATAQAMEFISSILAPRAVPERAGRGALVVLVGLDGSGKTTVAREICCQAGNVGSVGSVRYFHWRPAIFGAAVLPLPEFRNVPRKTRLGSNPLQSLLSLARLLKSVVLSNLAYWLRVRRLVQRGSLVLVDRYYYNYYLDPVSVKYYGPGWLLDRVGSFFPRPDLVVVLRAPVEILLARKQELTAEEISRQNELLGRVPFKAGKVLELDASGPAAESAREILRRAAEIPPHLLLRQKHYGGQAGPLPRERESRDPIVGESGPLNPRGVKNREPWEKLFASPGGGGEGGAVRMRLLRRGGEPFLLLPRASRMAARGLDLYAAQTTKARVAKSLLGMALGVGLPLGLEKVVLTINRGTSFADYLAQVAGVKAGCLAEFALLAGNPRVAGRRCILMVFDFAGTPKAVVKAGTDEEGFKLIEREVTFLKSAPPNTPGVPAVRSVFRAEGVSAFAMDFVSGVAPCAGDRKVVEGLLSSWVDSGRKVAIGELAAWQRLEAGGGDLAQEIKGLAPLEIHPAIYHGDFAPWNIKAKGEEWTLLDWERGELAGPPLWDWLHFIVQPAILVERCSTEVVVARIEGLLRSQEVGRYAERSGLGGREQAIAAAYLEYCVRVLRQSEGLEEVKAVREAVGRRWFPG